MPSSTRESDAGLLRATSPRVGLHDKAFRRLLKAPGAAEALVRERLPKRLTRRMVGPPVLLSESFVDDSLKGSVADAVFRVPLEGAADAFVYCVVEHKSLPEPRALVQVLRYLSAVYAWLDDKTAHGALPLVIPLLVYSGHRPWSGARRFRELLQVTPSLAALTLDFGVVMVDVAAEPLDALSRHPILKGGLLALRAATTPVPELEPVVDGMLHSLSDESTLNFVLQYLLEVMASDGLAVLDKSVRKHEQKGPQMQTIAQYLDARGYRRGRRQGRAQGREEGRVRGHEEGRAQGREEGLRESLRMLLVKRFKRLAPKYEALLGAADFETLNRWFDAALSAKSVKDVFAAR